MAQLWKALTHLFPNAVPLRDYTIVERDGVQSIALWNLPQPQPTQAELEAAEAAYDAAQATQQQEATALRNQIVSIAQGAVGVRVDQLTAAQVRALQAILLWQAGALNNDLTIRPLGQWANK